MRIDMNPQKKYIDIWLTHSDSPPDVQRLKTLYPDFDIVIWKSGAGDLTALTAELLKNNRDLEPQQLAASGDTIESMMPNRPASRSVRTKRKRSPSR